MNVIGFIALPLEQNFLILPYFTYRYIMFFFPINADILGCVLYDNSETSIVLFLYQTLSALDNLFISLIQWQWVFHIIQMLILSKVLREHPISLKVYSLSPVTDMFEYMKDI